MEKRQLAIVTLKKGEGRTIKSGGAWIFDNEIESIMGHFENGDGDGDVGVLRAETMQSFRHIRVLVALDDADAQSVRRTSVG